MLGNNKKVMGSWFAFCCLALIACVGCDNSADTDVSSVNKLNIQKVRNAYSIYSSRHGFKGPKNEQELKDYLREDKTSQVYLGRMGVKVEELDDIFISERDGEPFEIRWGTNGEADAPIVFEKTGQDGVRFVSFFKPREVSDASEYNDYLNGTFKPETVRDAIEKAELEAAEDGSVEKK